MFQFRKCYAPDRAAELVPGAGTVRGEILLGSGVVRVTVPVRGMVLTRGAVRPLVPVRGIVLTRGALRGVVPAPGVGLTRGAVREAVRLREAALPPRRAVPVRGVASARRPLRTPSRGAALTRGAVKSPTSALGVKLVRGVVPRL